MKNKVKRILLWLVFNLVTLGSLILGVFYAQDWAVNIFYVATAFQVVVSMFVFLAIASMQKCVSEIKTRGRMIPPLFLSHGVDFSIVLTCSAFGFFWCAAAWIFAIISEAALWSEEK